MGQSLVTIQNSLNAGEISPSMWGRTDLPSFHNGTTTCRNFFANYRGGVVSRGGLAYVGTCKQQYPVPPRDIPFQFSLTQGYVLEFGELYMRIKFQGAYVTEAAENVTSVSSAGLFTVTGHGYSNGDWIFDSGNAGFSGLTWIVQNVTTNTFTVNDLFGNAVTSATPSSGGTVARIYTVVSPYHAVDLPYLKYTQSADTMTLCCVNTVTSTEYPPYDLIRSGNTSWAFTQITFGATIAAPTGLAATATSSNILTTWYSYVVTAVSADTGEESIASNIASIQNNDVTVNPGSNNLTWTPVAGAGSYNVYAAPASYQVGVPVSSEFGFVGTAIAASFTDTGTTPDFTVVPPVHTNPFARGPIEQVNPTAVGINYSQQTVGYTVTSVGGTGFAGLPVVANGGVVDFLIENEGQGYQPGDTIAFTDSGGGVATGSYAVSANAVDGDSITINGVPLKFRRSSTAPAYNEFLLGNTLALTIASLAEFLNASTDVSLQVATYTYDSSNLYFTYKVPGVVGNSYTLGVGPTGWTRSGANLTGGGTMGSGATATLTIGPESGTYPSVVNYFQQRRVYGASLNQPDTYWMSQPGLFKNMDTSVPVTSGDAITGTPWAQQVNGIQFLQPMPGGLVVLTGKGAWQVNGGSAAAITPSNQTAIPQAFNGCHNLISPIQVNYDLLYPQSKGSTFRDLSYNFFVNIYTGNDLTVLSNHLFNNFTFVQWAWAEEPYKLIWAVRDDGTLLSMTYLKEQETGTVNSWTRHDTNGLFVSVTTINEPPADAPYFIVQRFVKGAWRYYSERMDNRIWENVEDSFCVDAGLAYPQTFPNAVLSPAAATGTGVVFTASSSVFNSGQVGDIIRVGGGNATVTSYTSGTQVVCTINQPITQTTPNDPNNTPEPAQPNNWSISVPTSSVSGLNHLEGLTVAILADGSVVPNQVVTNGTISLPEAASNIVVGLPYTCQVQTLFLDHQGDGQTVQTKRKNISAVGLRVENTRGIWIGADQPDASAQPNFANVPWTNLNEVKERTMFVSAGNAVPLFTGDYFKTIISGWDVTGQIAVQQPYPLPATVLAAVAYWQTGDDK